MTTLITGPMFSSKSSELFKQMERYIYAKKSVLFIRPSIDARGYFSHSKIVDTTFSNVYIKTLSITNFDDIVEDDLALYDAIFIDEFFMIKDIYKLATWLGGAKDLFFAGLIASSECNVFEEVIKLLPYCDYIIKLNAVCMECGSQLGNYSYFKGNKFTDIVVGDTQYEALCQTCYSKRIL